MKNKKSIYIFICSIIALTSIGLIFLSDLFNFFPRTSINTNYYKYEKYENEYYSFDHPVGQEVIIEHWGGPRKNKREDIADIFVYMEKGKVGIAEPSSEDTCIKYEYLPALPFYINYAWAEIDHDPFLPFFLSPLNYSYINSEYGFGVVSLDELTNNKNWFKDLLKQNKDLKELIYVDRLTDQKIVPLGKKGPLGVYTSCLPSGERKLFQPSKWFDYTASPFMDCNAKSTEDVKKCTEVLDRFVTTFKVKKD